MKPLHWIILALLGMIAVAGLSRAPDRVPTVGMSTITKRPVKPARKARPAYRTVKDPLTGLPVITGGPHHPKVTVKEIRALRDMDA